MSPEMTDFDFIPSSADDGTLRGLGVGKGGIVVRRMFWLALALVLLLAGCGGGNLLVAGEITEAEVEDGRLDSVVLRSRSTGKEVFVQLTEDTTVMPILEGATAEELLDGEGITGRLELEADCSTLTGICTAREIQITGARREQGITLSDGTAVEIWDTASFGTNYILPDGTELLRENRPSGPQNVHVGGVEGFDQLSAPAREAVAAYYAEQGLLYDVEEVLERAYADYRDDGDFSAYLVEQSVSPSASNERLMYFTTTVFCSIDSGTAEETSLPAVFDRETGEKLDIWSLFAVPEAEARAALLDKMADGSDVPRTELEAAFRPEYIRFYSSGLDVTFPRGTLPSQEYTTGGSFDYAELDGLLQPWAIPEEPEQER